MKPQVPKTARAEVVIIKMTHDEKGDRKKEREPVGAQKKEKKMVGGWRLRCNEDKQLRNLSSNDSKQEKGNSV